MKGMSNLIKQAQQLQSRMAQLQEELGRREIEAAVGGGMVTARVNGRQELLSLKIEPEVVDPADVDILQDLIVAAVNEALHRSREMVQNEMTKLTGGVQIPGLT